MPSIRRTKHAARDAAEIWHYIAEDNPTAADRMISEFEKKLELLAQFPKMGRDRSDLSRSLRSFPVGNYLLFYRPTRAGIEVIRIAHGARDLSRRFKRRR